MTSLLAQASSFLHLIPQRNPSLPCADPLQELATLCWAMPYLLGTDMPRPSAWLAHLEAHATARMASMQPQHVGHVLWAMAKLQHKPGASLLVAVCREVPLKLSAGSPGGPPYQQQQQQQGRSRPAQGPGRSIGGYTRTQGAASQQAGEEPGAQPARTWVVSPQALCTILWSIARMGVLVSPSLLESLVAALGARLHACNAFDLSSALYALALLGYRPDTKWMARFLQVRGGAADRYWTELYWCRPWGARGAASLTEDMQRRA